MGDVPDGKKNVPDSLRNLLDAVVRSTSSSDRLANDPVGLVRQFDNPRDQECVALIASTLSYGRVDLLRAAITRALAPLGSSPADALQNSPATRWTGELDGFVYRMTRGDDVADLYAAIGSVLREFGSIERAYLAQEGSHVERASGLVQCLRDRRHRVSEARGFRYLLPSPSGGSATKRLHMFFRWVVRGPDEIDLGLWRTPLPRDLIMPLDTHTSRIARYLGLTTRNATDLKAAVEVTDSLRSLCDEDPLVYDFALAHLGISGRCVHRRSPEHCPSCPLDAACTLGQSS